MVTDRPIEIERITKRVAADLLVVRVENPKFVHPPVSLVRGEEFEFGRHIGGAGRISEHDAVSRSHGRIITTGTGFSVVTTGSQIGVTVTDRTTPSKLVIPRGVGPVHVPFRDCSIIVDLHEQRDYLNVSVEGSALADAWAEAWGPQMRDRWFDEHPRPAFGTRQFFDRSPVRWRKTNGQPYAWFRTLAALCEPALGAAPAGTPTNGQLCTRLHQSKSVTERHLGQIYEAFDLTPETRDRDLVVIRAIDLGIITRLDLETI